MHSIFGQVCFFFKCTELFLNGHEKLVFKFVFRNQTEEASATWVHWRLLSAFENQARYLNTLVNIHINNSRCSVWGYKASAVLSCAAHVLRLSFLYWLSWGHPELKSNNICHHHLLYKNVHALPSREGKKKQEGPSHLGRGLIARLWHGAESTHWSVSWHCKSSLGKTGKHRWESLKDFGVFFFFTFTLILRLS